MHSKPKNRKPKSKKTLTLWFIGIFIISVLILLIVLASIVRRFSDMPFDEPQEINDQKKITLPQSLPSKQIIFKEPIQTSCSKKSGEFVGSIELIYDINQYIAYLEKAILDSNLNTNQTLTTYLDAVKTKSKTSNLVYAEEIIPNFNYQDNSYDYIFNRAQYDMLSQYEVVLRLSGESTPLPYITRFRRGTQFAPLAGYGETGYELPNGQVFSCGTWIS